MSEVAVQKQGMPAERRATPVEGFLAQVMGDESRRDELFRSLPSHIPPGRFHRNLLNLLMQNPEIMQYDPRLIYREVSKAAALGLSLDPQFAEADIIPVWNKQAKRKELELRPRYKGLIKLARQSGEIINIYPVEARENDFWLEEQGTERRLEHRVERRSPRGAVFCYYAVVVYKDGVKDFEVMDLEDIYDIREKSDGWRAFQNNKISTTPWQSDEGEMCKKTVIKRLLKRVPQSSDLAEALALDHDREPLPAVERQGLASGTQPALKKPAHAPRTIEARLETFARAPEQQESSSPPADDGTHQQGGEGEEVSGSVSPPDPAGTSSPAPAPPAAQAGAGEQAATPKIKDAFDRGRAAGQSGCARQVPKILKGAERKDEAEAFLRGWDEASAGHSANQDAAR